MVPMGPQVARRLLCQSHEAGSRFSLCHARVYGLRGHAPTGSLSVLAFASNHWRCGNPLRPLNP